MKDRVTIKRKLEIVDYYKSSMYNMKATKAAFNVQQIQVQRYYQQEQDLRCATSEYTLRPGKKFKNLDLFEECKIIESIEMKSELGLLCSYDILIAEVCI